MLNWKLNIRNRGQTMSSGLWKYSRHPNYFGECLVWWGIYLIATNVENGQWMLVGPTILTIYLYFVAIPKLERTQLEENKKGWKTYASRTSSFVMWF